MLDESRDRIVSELDDSDTVLDVGGWAHPFPRADWVVDLFPYETRGLYHYRRADREAERFNAETWVVRDICDREPWPFAADQFDFVVCSHTLEDVRDPVWVCQEIVRVGRSGYIEVPSRLEEQTVGVNGSWAGWAHHRWLCDVDGETIQFVHKTHSLHSARELTAPASYTLSRPRVDRVSQLWWQAGFSARERVFLDPEELNRYLRAGLSPDVPRRSRWPRMASITSRIMGCPR